MQSKEATSEGHGTPEPSPKFAEKSGAFAVSEELISCKMTFEETTTSKEEHAAAEEKLVARLRSREPQAFEELYEQHSVSLLRRLYRLTGNEADAEDCLQQVFVEAIETFDLYRGEGVLAAWLHRIATYIAMNLFRRRNRWHRTMERFQDMISTQSPQVAPLPQQLFEQMESRAWIRELLDKLSPYKRMAVILCDLEGWTQEEAALHLKVPLGTLVSRLYHGRRELKFHLEQTSSKAGLSIKDIFHE